MSFSHALVVSPDPETIKHFSDPLQELSISADVCGEPPIATRLLSKKKFDAVIVDLMLGKQSGLVLEEVRLSASNRTAVTFAISDSDAELTAAFRKTASFVFERPLSAQSIRSILRPSYGLILRERRRYFRCPICIPVAIIRGPVSQVSCYSVNVSEGGMALSTLVPFEPGEQVRVQFTLPRHEAPFLADARICWRKLGRVGVRFDSASTENKSDLQVWLARKLEDLLPGFVAETFQKEEASHVEELEAAEAMCVDGAPARDGTGQPTSIEIVRGTDTPQIAEERLRLQAAALDCAANSVVITAKDGAIIWTNRAFSEMTGYAAAEACGKNPRLLSSGKHDQSFYANIWQTINAGKTWQGEIINRRKNGSLYTEEQTITPLRSHEGEITHFVAIKQDVTERKRIEEALQQAEAKYRVLFADSADATLLMDEEGFLDCNSAALQLFGYSTLERMRHPADISPPNQPDGTPSLTAAEQKIAAAFFSGKERFEWLHQREDGTVFPADVCLTALTLSGLPRLLAIVRDITQRKRAEEALVHEHNLLRTLIDNMPDYIYAKDRNNRFLVANEALARRMGAANSVELVGKSDSDFYPPNLAAKYAHDERQIMESGQAVIDKEESTIDAASGQLVWHTTSEVPFRDQNGNVLGLLGIGHNITERKRAEEALRDSEETNRVTFELAAVGISHVAPNGKWLRVNDKLCEIVGYTREELMKMTFQDVTHPDDLKKELNLLRQLLADEIDTYALEERYIRKNQSIIWINLTVSLVRSASGQPQHFIAIIEDITDRKCAEERAQFFAYYDALTELPNRTLLQDRLVKAVAGARRRKERIALLFLDLDRFKIINDSLGHSAGDLLLQSVAARIKGWAREQDTVARLGGDEFLIMINGIKDISDAAVAAERLLDAMNAEFAVQGHSLNITCSLGISVFPDHGEDAGTLVKNADAAMYCSKEHGRNNFQFYSENMNAEAAGRLALEHGLRKALERKELFLVYQPQMEIATGKLIGFEALIRWQHPEMGLVPPDKFIRIAENSGLILPIGEWVLRTACSQARKWQDEGLPAISVAVNVSVVQFRQEGFCDLVRRVLNETGLAAQNLELELTESLLLADAEMNVSVIQELTAMGLTLAIDDFGSGYSSFSYLRRFRVNKLKIDRSFVRDVAVNSDDAAIASAIISMAKSLRLKVIAEGVEDEAQMSFLRSHQCDEIQGFYFSKPLTAEMAADKLRGTVS